MGGSWDAASEDWREVGIQHPDMKSQESDQRTGHQGRKKLIFRVISYLREDVLHVLLARVQSIKYRSSGYGCFSASFSDETRSNRE